ncbi:MAG TPA: hypothetical protein VJO33_02350, partial [Gemmatimonadaceae bacterium]|nr:hypothetical protein [Gemmatimonadaceae bacterium]
PPTRQASRSAGPTTAMLAVTVARVDGANLAKPATVTLAGPSGGSKPTDASGVAIFSGLAPGDYKVTVKLSEAEKAFELENPVFANAGYPVSLAAGDTRSCTARVHPPAALEVIVVGADGEPLLGEVTVKASGPSAGGGGTGKESGSLNLQDLLSGTYSLSLTLPDHHGAKYAIPAAAPQITLARGQRGQLRVVLPERPEPTIKVDDPKIALVRHKYLDDATLGVTPHRIPVTVGVRGEFDGTGELSCSVADAIKLFATKDASDAIAQPAPLTAEQLKKGQTLFVEAQKASDSAGGTELKLEIKGSSLPPKSTAASEKITCVKLEIDAYKSRPDGGGDPTALTEDEKIKPGRHVVVQGSSDDRLFSERALVVLKKAEPQDLVAKLVVKARTGGVSLFTDAQEVPAAGQVALTGAALCLDNAAIDAANGKRFWAQGQSKSGAMGDTGLTVELENIPGQEGDRITMTVLKLELRLHQSRKEPVAAAADPDALSDDDKLNTGRFLHVQDAGHHHGRALLKIAKVEPNDFVGKLTLTSWNAKHAPAYSATKTNASKVEIFADEVAAGGQVAIALGEIDHPATFPADGKSFWVQGKTVSGELRDAELRLGVKDADKGAERVAFTAVRLKNLKAEVPATPPNTQRLGNWPAAAHMHHVTVASDCAEDFTRHDALVLVQDSLPAASPVNLSVEVEPAGVGVPVSWTSRRDWRPAPNGDHDDVIALGPNTDDTPTITQDGGDPLKATLLADAVGSFFVRAYVDCNGTSEYDDNEKTGANAGQRIDREPYIVLPFVLIRVEGIANTSRSRQANVNIVPAVPTAATGVGVSTGNFAAGASAGVHCVGKVKVTGGGRDGTRGLNRLFAGWVNNEVREVAVSEYNDAGTRRRRNTVWATVPAHGVFQVISAPGAAYNAQAGPVLDCTNFGGEGLGGNSCVGTEGAPGPPAINRNAAQPAGSMGKTWIIQMWDSPGDSCPAAHESYPGRPLVRYRFNLDFRCDLVFWTNSSAAQGATAHPANRLYSRVYQTTWTIRLDIGFNALGVAAIATPLTIRLTKDNADVMRAEPVEGTGLEVRHPISLKLLLVNARP